MEKFVHVDDLEHGRIESIDFPTYRYPGTATFGLSLTEDDFNLLKDYGGIIGRNRRSENEKLAINILNILKKQQFKTIITNEKLLDIVSDVTNMYLQNKSAAFTIAKAIVSRMSEFEIKEK